MNISLSSKLIEDAAKIQMGIQFLQNRMMYVVNRHVEKNSDKTILPGHSEELEQLKEALIQFLKEQQEMNVIIDEAAEDLLKVENEMKEIIENNNLQIDIEPEIDNQI